jgi:hypothetical protein
VQVWLTLNPLKHLLRLNIVVIAIIISSCVCCVRYYWVFIVFEWFHCLIELFNKIRWFGY